VNANIISLPPGENELPAPLQQIHVRAEDSDHPSVRLHAVIALPLGTRTLPGRLETATMLAIHIHPRDAIPMATQILELAQRMGWQPPP
jgi:hypothetical protein